MSSRGTKWGAIVRRCQAMLSPYKRSIYLLDLVLSACEPHHATTRSSFASRGSGVQILSSTQTARSGPLFQPLADTIKII